MARRRPAPPPDKTLVGFDEIPDWVYTFMVPDDFDRDTASNDEIRAAYLEWQARVQEWRNTHETPTVAAAVALPDEPFDPYAEIEAGTL